MSLFDSAALIHFSQNQKFTLTAVPVEDLAQLNGAILGAESAQAPLILEISANHPILDYFMPAIVAAARQTTIPVAIQFVCTASLEESTRGIRLGATSILIDHSTDKNSEKEKKTLNAIAMMCRECDIPLLLTQSPESVVYTHFNSDLNLKHTLAEVIIQACRKGESTGMAPNILAHTPSRKEIEHIILFNTEGLDVKGSQQMMLTGQKILAEIPGVRRVVIGQAVQDNAQYRYFWNVRFSSARVIDSYKVHPDHQAFADQHFRPFAGGRISIDYLEFAPTLSER